MHFIHFATAPGSILALGSRKMLIAMDMASFACGPAPVFAARRRKVLSILDVTRGHWKSRGTSAFSTLASIGWQERWITVGSG